MKLECATFQSMIDLRNFVNLNNKLNKKIIIQQIVSVTYHYRMQEYGLFYWINDKKRKTKKVIIKKPYGVGQ